MILSQIIQTHSDALGPVKTEHRSKLNEDKITGARLGATNVYVFVKASPEIFPFLCRGTMLRCRLDVQFCMGRVMPYFRDQLQTAGSNHEAELPSPACGVDVGEPA